jgi:hypothetical protein
VRSLFTPYNGSLYLLQRVIALAGVHISPRYAPTYYNYASLLVCLAVMVYVMHSRTALPAKSLFALAVVASPHYNEVYLTLTNIHWISGLALLVLIVSDDPNSAVAGASDIVILLATALSGLFIVLFWPLLVARALIRRSAFSWLALCIAMVCVWLQAAVVEPNRAAAAINIHDPSWITFWANRFSRQLFVGRWSLGAFTPPQMLYFGSSSQRWGSWPYATGMGIRWRFSTPA